MDTLANKGRPFPEGMERLLAEREWLRGLARRLIADPAAADDLAQDALLLVLQRRESGRSLERPRALLATILRRKRASKLRAETSRQRRELQRGTPPEQPATDDLVAQAEAQAQVANALMRLPEDLQEVLLLRFHADLKVAEISRRLGLPDSTVRGRLERGLAELRKHLDADGSRSQWAGVLAPWAFSDGVPLTTVAATLQPLALAASAIALGWSGWGLVRSAPVEVAAPGMEQAASLTHSIELEAGEARPVTRIESESELDDLGMGLLALNFVDDAGHGVEDVKVAYVKPDGTRVEYLRDGQSRYLLGGLYPGLLEVELEHDAFVPRTLEVRVEPGREELRVELARRRFIALQLFDPEGAPLAETHSAQPGVPYGYDSSRLLDRRLGIQARIHFSPDSEVERSMEHQAAWNYAASRSIGDITWATPLGHDRGAGHLMWIEAKLTQPFFGHLFFNDWLQVSFRIDPALDAVRIELEPEALKSDQAKLTLRAVDPTGMPVTDAKLIIGRGQEVPVDAQTGELFGVEVPAGAKALRLESEGLGAWWVQISERGGATAIGDVELRPWVERNLRVEDAAGVVVGGRASLMVQGTSAGQGSWTSGRTSAADEPLLLRAPAGSHLLRATAFVSPGEGAQQWVEFDPLTAARVETIRLAPEVRIKLRWSDTLEPDRLRWGRVAGASPGRAVETVTIGGRSSLTTELSLGEWWVEALGEDGEVLATGEYRVEAETEELYLGERS